MQAYCIQHVQGDCSVLVNVQAYPASTCAYPCGLCRSPAVQAHREPHFEHEPVLHAMVSPGWLPARSSGSYCQQAGCLQCHSVQNADDNSYSSKAGLPVLELVTSSSAVSCLNNEAGFTPDDVEGICEVGGSKKQGKAGFTGVSCSSQDCYNGVSFVLQHKGTTTAQLWHMPQSWDVDSTKDSMGGTRLQGCGPSSRLSSPWVGEEGWKDVLGYARILLRPCDAGLERCCGA